MQDASGQTVVVTDDSWSAQTFYTAPLNDRSCLVDTDNVRDSSSCATEGSSDGTRRSAAFWQIPVNWMKAEFDDTAWPSAVTYTNDVVGVDNKKAYTNFTSVFDGANVDAEFIWSSNLVLMRKTIE